MDQNPVYYKMESCQTIFVNRDAAGKGIHYHHISLFCVWKFRNNIEIRGIQLNETEFKLNEQNRTELY